MSAEIHITGNPTTLSWLLDLILSHIAKPGGVTDYGISIATKGLEPAWKIERIEDRP